MVTAFPTRAFVLAAGFGTRMRPLSYDVPKPLMPIWNKPALQRILEMLRAWGVREVLINLHHGADQIFSFVHSNPVPGLRIAFSFEPEILGTGGALRRAEWFVRRGPFWLVNADIVAQVNPNPLRRAFRRAECLAALWLHPTRGPRTVEMKNGWIRSFEAVNPGGPNTYTFCGLHLLSPRILQWLPRETKFTGIIEAYQRAMAHSERIAGVCVNNALWFDIGSPFQYLETHRALFPMIGKPFVAAAPTARISPHAQVENSVVWDGATLTATARVRNAVIGRMTVVRGEATHVAVRAELALAPEEQAVLRQMRWRPEKTTAILLEPRGSARTFTRLEDGRRSLMLVRYDSARAENALYAQHARFLARLGLRVPHVRLDEPHAGRIWLEDLGTPSVQSVWRALAPEQQRKLYGSVLDAIARLHNEGASAARRARLTLMPPFDSKLYRWERNYFADQLLRGFAKCDEAVVQSALRDLARVARRLEREPAVLLHRDLQSSNILLVRGKPAFIDFQGMRLGPAAYDVASLLCDPYLNLSEAEQMYFLAYYNRRAMRAITTELFWLAAVERLAQALGAYARLGSMPGLATFRQYIPPALCQLERALARSPQLAGKTWFSELARRLANRGARATPARRA